MGESSQNDGKCVGEKRKREEMEDEDQDERMCRYCFGGEEDGELISPCDCKGGQKFVHLNCLRRWREHHFEPRGGGREG